MNVKKTEEKQQKKQQQQHFVSDIVKKGNAKVLHNKLNFFSRPLYAASKALSNAKKLKIAIPEHCSEWNCEKPVKPAHNSSGAVSCGATPTPWSCSLFQERERGSGGA